MAQALLDSTDRAFRLLVSDRWLAGIYRTRVASKIAAVAMRLQRVRTFAFKALAQTGIAYHKSPLSQTLDGVAAAAPRAGDRFPWLHLRFRTDGPREDLFARLNDTRFNLLVFGQPAPSPERLGFGEVLEVHAVPSDPENAQELARVSISGPAYYPLRPDGHIGLAGTRFDDAAPKRWFSMAGVRSDASGSSHKLDGLTVRVTGAA